jgi:transcription elongation GreA/GreB family factor
MVNARLNQLKKRLAEISMIDFSKIPHDRVGLGSTVVVLDSKRDEEVTYNLVTRRRGRRGQRQDLHHLADRPCFAGQGSG